MRRAQLDRERKRLIEVSEKLEPITTPECDVIEVLHGLACTRCPDRGTENYVLYRNCAVWSALRVAYAEGGARPWHLKPLVERGPIACRRHDPWGCSEDEEGLPVNPRSCRVCGMMGHEHS